jgi:chromosome segregation protein
MRLKHIKLSGFKSFVDLTTVPFIQQMTAVVGPNGCGKSNVIDAVRWVLGESSAKNLRGDAMTDVIFNGSSHRKPVSQAAVELLFENTQGHISGNLADRSEIAVKRIVTRDAQSTYYLNGTKCRRRDITDIFLGTGLGPRSYAIIEQGMISRLIESKPQELRVFIEEAAGISKYKERRRDTENRIKRTRENLERLSDVRDELGKNIDRLKRQATAAQRYKELKAQERKLKAEVTSIKWLSYNTRLQQLEQQLAQQSIELEKYHAEQSAEQSQLETLKQQALQSRQQFEQLQASFYQLGSVISRIEQQIVFQSQQQQQLNQQLQQAEQSLQQSTSFIANEQQQYQQLSEQIAIDEPEIAILDEQLAQLELQLAEIEQQQISAQQGYQQWQQQQFQLQKQQQQLSLQLQNQQQQQQQISQQILQMEQEISQLATAPLAEQYQQQLQQLALAEQNYRQQQQHTADIEQRHAKQAQLLEAAKQQLQAETTVLHSLQLEQQRLSKLQQQQENQQQQLLRQLVVKPGWALAVTMALGQLQHAKVLTDSDAKPQHDNTQASFVYAGTDVGLSLPLKADAKRLSSVIESGVYPQSFDQILLANNAADAYALQVSLSQEQSIISADGVWLGVNWGLYAGAEQDNYLQIRERLTGLKQQINTAQLAFQQAEANKLAQQQQFDSLTQELRQHQQQLAAGQQQVQQQQTALLLAEQALQQANKQQAKLVSDSQSMALNQAVLLEKIAEYQAELELCEQRLLNHEQQQQQLTEQQQQNQQQLSHHKAFYEQKRQQQQQLVLQCKMSQQQQQTLALSIQRAEQQQQQLQQQMVEFKLKLQQDDEPELVLQAQLQQSLLELEQAEHNMHRQQDEVSELEQRIRLLEQGQQSIEQLAQQKRAELESLRVEAEGYRVRANNMLEQLEQQQANIKQVLAELVPEADEAQWQQRLELTTEAIQRLGAINLAAIDEYEQQAERKHYLDAQNDDLQAAMETLETAIRKIDKETRQKFKQTFEQVNEGLKSLFPKVFGGGSAYLALTEDDLLETGVSIMARPPGKKNSTIHLLSGGEKALTALSLVFSIFQLNPAPFCMLDEVDAPLDDANVGRFCNLVREMSETVQFIYISHNKIAMEMATQLMGVTMQEPGVSRVVAVDVDDAVKMTADF